MGLIGTMAVAIIGDISGLDSSLKKAKRDLDQFNKDVEKVAGGLTNMGSKLSMGVTLPILGAGAAAFKMAADMQDAMGATDQIFKASSSAMKTWADGLPSYYGIASGEALEYANMMGSMLQNIGGLTAEQAGKQAQDLIGLAGDLTAMYGGTTQDAVRALTGALKGNNTMLDNYGMAVTDAMVKSKAMEMGLLAEGEQMDLAAKQAATLALIMEQSGAAQGQAAREADGASGSMRAMGTELKNIGGTLGEILLPVITPFLAKINEMLQKFREMSPATQEMIVKVAGIAAMIGPALLILGQLVSVVGGAIGAFGSLGLAIKGGATGVGVLMQAFPMLGSVMTVLTGPVGLIVAAVVGLGLAIMALWKTNEDFRNSVKSIWDSIKSIIGVVVDFLAAQWDKYGGTLVSVMQTAWGIISTVITTATKIIAEIIQLFLNVLTGNWTGAWENIKNIFKASWNGIINVLKGLIKIITDLFTGMITAALDWGKNLMSSFIRGIKSMFGSLRDTVKAGVETVKDFLGFESPTKKGPGRFVEEWGGNMLDAFMDGMKSRLPDLRAAVAGVAFDLNPSLVAAGVGAGATTNSYGGNNIYITVNGNWADIERELNRRGVRI